LVFELFTGEEVFSIVKKRKKLSEPQAAYCMSDLFQVMIHLKDSGIAHRDIKAENMLINETTFDVKLIDFGLSVFIKDKALQESCGGSPLYSSPEILAGEKFDPIKADLWSAGVLLFYMLCGNLDLSRSSPFLRSEHQQSLLDDYIWELGNSFYNKQ
jgi:serine/threonine protein kinase